MISFRVLGSVAAIALVLPMAAPRASFAQPGSVGRAAGHSGPGGGGGAPPAARFNGGGRGGGGPVYVGRGGGGGGGWQGGTAGVYHRHGGGFIPGAVAGAVIGGVIAAAPYGYYGPGYNAPGYYDEQYYDNGPVVVAPEQGSGDTVDYCIQTYGSYDPPSGTYLGLDGLRHLCP
jgi:hypothetical protein